MFVTQKDSSCRSDLNCRQRKTCYNYRSIAVFVLALVMFFASVIPANAAEVPATDVINLMDSALFKLFVNDIAWNGGNVYYDPSGYFDVSGMSINSIRWQWQPNFNIIVRNVYITVQCRRQPDHLYVSPWNANFTYSDGEYVGSPVAGLHTYRFDTINNGAYLNVMGAWDDEYYGSFNIVSAYGCVNTVESIPRVGFEVWPTYVKSDATLVQECSYNLPNAKLPWGVRAQRNDYDLTAAELTIKVNPAQRDTNLAETMTVVFAYHGDSFGAGAALYDSAGNIITPLDVTEGAAFQYENLDTSSDALNFDLNYQSIVVNLHGYDLRNMTVVVTLSVDASYMGNMDKKEGCYLLCNSVYITPVYEAHDPYKGKVTYFLENIWTSIKSGSQSIADTIKEVFSGGGAGEALNQASQNMNAVSSSMSDANSQLNSVEKPSLDTGQLFGDMLQFDTGGLVVLSAITSNPYVTSVMVVVFTFALCGYVFFGKKG